ncbi:MAG TPA: membrane protein insertion efficiency factor YidD [Clostridia bacterium]|nr:membrane protein insertion efficiency factor YidD [Clostridia bacterium]
MKRLLIKIVEFYQNAISPFLPKSCRYIPTCSQYTIEALEKYGAIKGSYFGAKRILRCHPFHPGGYDPLK